MSRSDYHYDGDSWSLIRWRGAVSSAIRGKRGQTLLKELLQGLDGMDKKELIADALEHEGCHCALGVVGKARGIPLNNLDPENSRQVAETFDIADALAREIVFINDEGTYKTETNAERWVRVRKWVAYQVREESVA